MRFSCLIIFVLLILPLYGCDMEKYPQKEADHKPELLVYSGMTMVEPLMAIIAILEERESCRVKVSYGASGHIARSVEVNRLGDIFFPGKISYITEMEKQGIVVDSALLGHNAAGIFVQPGNPLMIQGDEVLALLDPELKIVIGSPRAGSIGQETQRILQTAGIYQDVVDNALFMTTDSKGLVKAIKDREADLVINWRSVQYSPGNNDAMEFIALPSLAVKQSLVMGVLKYSQQPELAKKMLELATSDEGRAIFKRYGFYD